MADVGIFGGTFDPVHNAHLKIAKAAYEELSLDKVIFLPGGNPPHKTEKKVTDKNIRFKMVEAAIKSEPCFEVSDYEVKKETYSYTAKTLEYFKEKNPDDNYFFIIGEDSLAYLEKWYKPEVIVRLSEIAVYARGDNSNLDYEISRIKNILDAEIKVIDAPRVDISSTEIRKLVKEGADIKDLVPEDVLKIIKAEKLYMQENFL